MTTKKKYHISKCDSNVLHKGIVSDSCRYVMVGNALYEISNETAIAIQKSYSEGGLNLSIAEMADKFSVDKAFMKKLLSSLELTHDSDSVSDTEIATRSESDLLREQESARIEKVLVKLRKNDEALLKRDANRWRNIETAFSEMATKYSDVFRHRETIPFMRPSPSDRKYALMLPITDFHYGKYGSPMVDSDYPYNRFVARELLRSKLARIVSDALVYGTPERVYLPFGSDWFHIDNKNNSTTKGTPQDVDGIHDEIFAHGLNLFFNVVDSIARITPTVVLVYMPGNHDDQDTKSMYHTLWERYKDSSHVVMRNPIEPGALSYLQGMNYHDNAMFTHHGDRYAPLSANSLGEIIATITRSSAYADFKNVLLFTGDKHHDKCEVKSNIRWEQAPSISGTDQYHAKHGYSTTDRALVGYMIEPRLGLTHKFLAPATAEEFKSLFAQSQQY